MHLRSRGFRAEVIVKNRGSAASHATGAALYLSSDAAWDSADQRLGELAIKALPAGGRTRLDPFRYRGARKVTGRYLITRLDSSDTEVESNENNNLIVRRLKRPGSAKRR